MTNQEVEELRELLQRWAERGIALDAGALQQEAQKLIGLIQPEGESEFGTGSTSPASISEAMVILPRRSEFGMNGHKLSILYSRSNYILARRESYTWKGARDPNHRVKMTMFLLEHCSKSKTVKVLDTAQPGTESRWVEARMKEKIDLWVRQGRTT